MWRARIKRVFYVAGFGFAGYYAADSYKNFNDQIIAKWSSQYANVPIPTRAEHKQKIANEEFDILVIGGGATGAGIALDAATRGLKVALVERDDFASGTSSRSTKLLHGGIRYLEKAAKTLDYGEFKLVTEALHERTRVLKNAPHLSRPLPLVLPIRSWIDLPQYWIGLKLYDTISGASGMFKSYYLSRDKTVSVFPTINPDTIACSVVYYDGQMNDARLNVSIALTAAAHGASVINHTEVLNLLKQPNPHRPTSGSDVPLTTHTTQSIHTPTPPEIHVQSPPEPVHPPETSHIPDTAPQETATDAGVSMSSPAESPTSSSSSSQSSQPSYLPPPLPPPSPSPPPSPDVPFDKWIESLKSYITGSDKNKVPETDVRLLGDHLVTGAKVKDVLTGEVYEVHAKCVINATGPYADTIRVMDDPGARPLVVGSAGSHIILPNYFCPPNYGFVDAKSPDGRVIFLLPFENHTLVGTTDYPCELSHEPKPPESDITFILDQVRSYLHPDIKVKRSDVLAAWTGIRPLALDHSSHNTAAISRNHVIHVDQSGLVTIVGGKWTTYRRMAEETVEKAVKTCLLHAPHKSHTEKLPLWGAHKFKPTLFITLMQNYGLEQDIAQHLAHNYGDKAVLIAELARKGYGRRVVDELPYLEAEIVYSVNEYAETAVDVLARRTRLAFLDNEKSKFAVPKVIDLLAAQLQWDDDRKARETIAAYAFLETMK